MQACEAPEIEAEGAPLGDTEEVDAVNRGRWERCIHRHNAGAQCFDALRRNGVLRDEPRGRGDDEP